jgi:hypothetical protein
LGAGLSLATLAIPGSFDKVLKSGLRKALSPEQKLLVKNQRALWARSGEVPNMTDEAVMDLIDKRKNEIMSTAPSQFILDESNKLSLHNKLQNPTLQGNLTYDIDAKNNLLKIKHIENLAFKNNIGGQKVSVSEPLYKGLLARAKSGNRTGFTSGDYLLNPEKTIPTLTNNFQLTRSPEKSGFHRYKESEEDFFRNVDDPEDMMERQGMYGDESN